VKYLTVIKNEHINTSHCCCGIHYTKQHHWQNHHLQCDSNQQVNQCKI